MAGGLAGLAAVGGAALAGSAPAPAAAAAGTPAPRPAAAAGRMHVVHDANGHITAMAHLDHPPLQGRTKTLVPRFGLASRKPGHAVVEHQLTAEQQRMKLHEVARQHTVQGMSLQKK